MRSVLCRCVCVDTCASEISTSMFCCITKESLTFVPQIHGVTRRNSRRFNMGFLLISRNPVLFMSRHARCVVQVCVLVRVLSHLTSYIPHIWTCMYVCACACVCVRYVRHNQSPTVIDDVKQYRFQAPGIPLRVLRGKSYVVRNCRRLRFAEQIVTPSKKKSFPHGKGAYMS